MGPNGDVALRKSGKGKLDIFADVLRITKTLELASAEKITIKGLPLKDYITKVVLAALENSGLQELLMHVEFQGCAERLGILVAMNCSAVSSLVRI